MNAKLTAPVTKLSPPPPAPVPRPLSPDDAQLRADRRKATINNLRQFSSAVAQFSLEYGRPPFSIDEIVGEGKYIRRLNPVNGENYAMLSLATGAPLTVYPADGEPVTYDPNAAPPPLSPEAARVSEMTQKFRPAISKAVESYPAAHNGDAPPRNDPMAVLPYFATPQEGADFVELLDAQKAAAGK